MHFWPLITRLGEAEILLPAMLLMLAALVRQAESRPLAWSWTLLLAAAVGLTTASKVAFLGWGVGSAPLDFTGISGHSMFAAAVYPLLAGLLAGRAPRWGRACAIGAGIALALLVGLSRVMVGAHSPTEVIAGLALGSAVGALGVRGAGLPRLRLGPVLPATLALWLAWTPAHAPASRTHSAVTEIALTLSGRQSPWQRTDLSRHGAPPAPRPTDAP